MKDTFDVVIPHTIWKSTRSVQHLISHDKMIAMNFGSSELTVYLHTEINGRVVVFRT